MFILVCCVSQLKTKTLSCCQIAAIPSLLNWLLQNSVNVALILLRSIIEKEQRFISTAKPTTVAN